MKMWGSPAFLDGLLPSLADLAGGFPKNSCWNWGLGWHYEWGRNWRKSKWSAKDRGREEREATAGVLHSWSETGALGLEESREGWRPTVTLPASLTKELEVFQGLAGAGTGLKGSIGERKYWGEDLRSSLEMGTEKKGRPQQVVCYKAEDKTGKLVLEKKAGEVKICS